MGARPSICTCKLMWRVNLRTHSGPMPRSLCATYSTGTPRSSGSSDSTPARSTGGKGTYGRLRGSSTLRVPEARGGLAGGVARGAGSEKSNVDGVSRVIVRLSVRIERWRGSWRRVLGVTGDRGGAYLPCAG